jgi:voltage-gated sodium channel
VIIGLGTSPEAVARAGGLLALANGVCLAIFVVEAALKITACGRHPGRYFRDGWNLFDFSIVVVSLIPAAGPVATLARLARLLRVLRLVSAWPELRLIVATLVRSLPGMGHVIALMSLVFYVYAVAGVHLFRDHDPEHWGHLGIALITLFRVVTLEDWTDVMYIAMDAHPMAWLYFISFVILGTFVVINLFIAVVLNNLDEAKTERLRELRTPPDREEILAALDETREALGRLHHRLDLVEEAPTAPDEATTPDAAHRRESR